MVAAAGIPPLAETYGITAALMLPAIMCALVLPGCAIGLRNPARPKEPNTSVRRGNVNPYRASRYLMRIHATSAVLAIPQLSLQTFGLVWIMSDLNWSTVAAGALVGCAQFLGALGRVIVGSYSDSIGRTTIIRRIAVCNIFAFLAMGFSAFMNLQTVAVILFIIATFFSVADNGPAFTAVAEFAGPFWSGKALGVQNTSQNLAGFAVGPAVGAMIEIMGFPAVLTLLAVAPAISLTLTPKNDQHYGGNV